MYVHLLPVPSHKIVAPYVFYILGIVYKNINPTPHYVYFRMECVVFRFVGSDMLTMVTGLLHGYIFRKPKFTRSDSKPLDTAKSLISGLDSKEVYESHYKTSSSI